MSSSPAPDPLYDRNWRNRQLVWIMLLAITLRVIWTALIDVVPISDSHAYDTFARNLLDHGVYGWTSDNPYAFWPPGTSFLYAAIYYAFGIRYINIAVFNIFLSCGLIVTSARVAARLYGDRVGVFAALVLAVWPTLILFTTILASELPFLLFTIAALDAWTARDRSWLMRGAIAGLLLGAASLVRPLALALPIIYGGTIALANLGLKNEALRQARLAVVCLLVMAAVIAPWTWRNYRVYGEPVLISTNGGALLWMGNAPGTGGGYLPLPSRLDHLNDNERSKALGEEAKQFILNDPVGFGLRSFLKGLRLYYNESIGVIWNEEGIEREFGPSAVTALKRFTQITWAVILSLALFGTWIECWVTGWRSALLSPIFGSIMFYSAVSAVTVSQDRYHIAFAAQLAMLAGIALAKVFPWYSRRRACLT